MSKREPGALYQLDSSPTPLTISQIWGRVEVKLCSSLESDEYDIQDFLDEDLFRQEVLEIVEDLVEKNFARLPKPHRNFVEKATVIYREKLLEEAGLLEGGNAEDVKHFLHWVGGKYYSRDGWWAEALHMGASIRVGVLPSDLTLGKSRVYLVSDMSDRQRKIYLTEQRRKKVERRRGRKTGKRVSFFGSKIKRGRAKVFGYFTVGAIVHVVAPGRNLPKKLRDRGITAYEFVEGGFGFEDERGCGSIKIGGTYLISEEDMKKCRDLAGSKDLVSDQLFPIEPPLLWRGGRFRGLRKYDVPPALFNHKEDKGE